MAGIRPPDLGDEVLDAVLVENLRHAAPRFADAGVKLLIEPINSVIDIPGFFLDTTRHAVRILDAVGSDNLFIQFDFYHVQVMQGDLVRTFASLQQRVAHVQIADHPGRLAPGTGEISYGFVLGELDRLGYDGWVGCEYRPRGGTGADLGWMGSP
jgi:hydroxypyruvate isomerase